MNRHFINRIHIIIEFIGYGLHLMAVVYAIVCACTIEGDIPTHYDISGLADAYGPASSMLIEPLSLLAVCIMLSLIAHLLPRKYMNTGFRINPGHEAAVYADMNYMILLPVPLLGLFSILCTWNYSNPDAVTAATVLEMILIFGEIGFCFIKAYKDNKD